MVYLFMINEEWFRNKSQTFLHVPSNLVIVKESRDLKDTPLRNGFLLLHFKAWSFGDLDKKTFLQT